ncbi:MAG: hypothetical protein GY943_02385 [Chloroflexi bacterium]|nr:hypothetical protein [Chloroflexota bacterium]
MRIADGKRTRLFYAMISVVKLGIFAAITAPIGAAKKECRRKSEKEDQKTESRRQ